MKIIFSIFIFLLSYQQLAYADAADSKKTYDFYCAQCHGIDGKGNGPNVTKDLPVEPFDFTDKNKMLELTDEHIKDTIQFGGSEVGKSPLMPAWGHTLNKTQVNDLAHYVRKFCQCGYP